jgi:hypothetical protein
MSAASRSMLVGFHVPPITPLSYLPLIWLNPSGTPVTNGANITTWTDSSGNGNDMVNTDGTYMTVVTSFLNGFRVGHNNNNANSCHVGVTLTSSGIYTLFYLFNVADQNNYKMGRISTGAGGNHDIGAHNDGSNERVSVDSDGQIITPGTWYTFVLSVSGGGSTGYLSGDGGQSFGDLHIGNTSPTVDFGNSPNGGPWKGHLAEFAMYNSALSSAQATALHSYAVKTYGIA